MAGRALPAPGGRPEVHAEHRALVACARPSPEEVMSAWPEDRRHRLVVWIRVDADGAVQVGARLREADVDASGPRLARDVRRIRGDVPIVFDLPGEREVVLPWRSLKVDRQVPAVARAR